MKTLVSIVLRGGADGLSLAAPVFSPDYHRLRPSLSLAFDAAEGARRALPTPSPFGLHPELAPIAPWLEERALTVAVAVGTDDDTRSHFEAQDRLEQGFAGRESVGSGWLARLLASRGSSKSPLRAVAVGRAIPESLRGAAASAVPSLEELLEGAPSAEQLDAILSLYAAPLDAVDRELQEAARTSVDALASLRKDANPPIATASQFPTSPLGERLATTATLLGQAEALGLEIVTIDHDGWDSHFAQGAGLTENVRDLARGLCALRESLGERWHDTTVLVTTEFGRRVEENVSLGTDHGRASIALVAGGGLRTAPFVGRWPGLRPADLEGPGDLRVTTDVRTVLASVLEDRLGVDSRTVFPNLRERVCAALTGDLE
jgi:uncharacterized protein (DUF1501 family)